MYVCIYIYIYMITCMCMYWHYVILVNKPSLSGGGVFLDDTQKLHCVPRAGFKHTTPDIDS